MPQLRSVSLLCAAGEGYLGKPWQEVSGGSSLGFQEEKAAVANFHIYWLIFPNALRPEEGFSMTLEVTLGASLGGRFWV